MIDSVASPEVVSPAIERIAIEAYRRMSAPEKLRRLGDLGRFLEDLAASEVRKRHPHASPDEIRLRVAARSYDHETMVRLLGWDPAERGA